MLESCEITDARSNLFSGVRSSYIVQFLYQVVRKELRASSHAVSRAFQNAEGEYLHPARLMLEREPVEG